MATYSPPGLLRPIPTSLVRGDFLGTPTPVPYYPPSCLDEVVNDAFLQAIGVLKDASKIEKVESFRRFIEGIHCQENLEFLVAIYTYDYYYEKLVPEATKQMKGSETLSKQISLHSTTTSTGFMPGFDDDDIDFVHQSPENSPASSDVSEDPYEMDVTHVQFLNNMWRDILSTFILDDAAKQINLSASHYDEVLEHSVADTAITATVSAADGDPAGSAGSNVDSQESQACYSRRNADPVTAAALEPDPSAAAVTAAEEQLASDTAVIG
ncbi:hypothetical protein DIURU_005706 [Diutina rugosa]|uniref:Uncharacterized protein n=1 Tax=Diutina rugosa TaxID=5481 RepID=A0A642UCG4_DIURU|nr:uncharacterized protein DIURU_005706 [Diutina rugosa]KAA8896694.1 hypothetical protein DIURU_005706 [Diutina rugosa]